MTNDQKKQLETQLWNIADSLRGKMNADEFRDYCLGFIFYKYLSERLYLYANEILAEHEIDFLEIDENSEEGQEYLEAIKEESIAQLGYFLKPSDKIEAEFYEQYFDGGFLNRELSKIAQEGARNHGLLNMSVIEFFKDININYSSLEEQEKIANFLTSIDKKIEAVELQIEKLEEFKKGLLQKMFV